SSRRPLPSRPIRLHADEAQVVLFPRGARPAGPLAGSLARDAGRRTWGRGRGRPVLEREASAGVPRWGAVEPLPPQASVPLARAALLVPQVRRWEAEYERLNDAELRTAGLRLRGRGRGGESLDRLLPEAFGLVCVAARRLIGLRPFDVQLAAGVVLHQGGLA